MYMYNCILYTCTCTCTYTYTCNIMYTCTFIASYIHVHVHVHTLITSYIHVHVHISLHTTDGRFFSVSRLGPSYCPIDPSLESVLLSDDCILVSLTLLNC